MDEHAVMTPPQRLTVHLDNFVNVPTGERLTKVQVENEMLHTSGEHCWCKPIIIEPWETRSALELWADYIYDDVHPELAQ